LNECEISQDVEKKLSFLIEQLNLATCPTNRRYSPNLLATASMWLSNSPSLYKQLLAEGFLSLPAIRHLKRISQALSVECGLSASAKAYLKTRAKNLSNYDKIVNLIFVEIYTAQRVEFQSGKLYGFENDSVTKKSSVL
jgi:hypothetical protein